jgi:hypothetical protein
MSWMGRVWTALFCAVIITIPVGQAAFAQTWRPVAGGLKKSISGMAVVKNDSSRTVLLIVHDNKRAEETKAALVTVEGEDSPVYAPLDWPGEQPVDLEALTTIPGKADEFIVLASAGNAYHIKVKADSKKMEVMKVFALPEVPDGSNFEGFALQKVGDTLIAVWGHRGSSNDPGVLYWGRFDPGSHAFTEVQSAKIQVPWPEKDVRHISDLKVDSGGGLFLTAASDPGDDGPFSSAFYQGGTFVVAAGKVQFLPNPNPVRLLRFRYYKIEALELIPGKEGGVLFGTDDENRGASLYRGW